MRVLLQRGLDLEAEVRRVEARFPGARCRVERDPDDDATLSLGVCDVPARASRAPSPPPDRPDA